MKLCFRFVREDSPGEAWQEIFRQSGDAYRQWFLAEGTEARPALARCESMLQDHLPELVPLWRRLGELAGGGELEQRMLSLVCPTPFLSGCTQGVWTRGEPRLVRNYDFHPRYFEAVCLRSDWHGVPVMATIDCLWGALDGINGHGLAVALAFGGRPVQGDGIGIPLILRYVLEFCRTTAEATLVLCRTPSNMAYNVSVVDATGDFVVVELAPDRPAVVRKEVVCTNHQGELEWPAYDERSQSVQRIEYLRERLRDPALEAEQFVNLFLHPPLYATDYRRAHGTLYTVEYQPVQRRGRFLWPRGTVLQSLHDFREQELMVPLAAGPREV